MADSVNAAPAAGALSLTDAGSTTRSGWSSTSCRSRTVICSDAEQLFVRLDSFAAASTHAP